MIRNRLTLLDSAAGCAIEMLRSAKHVEDVAQAVLELLAQAAGSEWATYWVIDPELQRLRPLAVWSVAGLKVQARERDARCRTASLSHGNAGHVWRSRKPLWATSFMLDPRLPRAPDPAEAGLHAGLWFALKTDTAVYGVIELLGRALEPKTPDNLIAIERLGFRLGLALEELRHGNARLH